MSLSLESTQHMHLVTLTQLVRLYTDYSALRAQLLTQCAFATLTCLSVYPFPDTFWAKQLLTAHDSFATYVPLPTEELARASVQ
jgi:hypothetical protein